MNKLDFNGGAYRCEVVEGAIFEGNVGNLVAHFATDTITLHDRATRSAVSILSSRTENLQINGSVVSFEQAQTIIENALKQGGGGGASSADAVSYDNTTSGLTATNVQSALDEVGANLGELSPKVNSLMSRADVIVNSAENVAYKNTNVANRLDEITAETINNFEWVEGKYISNSGSLVTSSDLKYSKPYAIKKGDRVVVNGAGTGISAIAKTDATATSYSVKVAMTDGNVAKDYEWIADEDCYVAFSGRCNRDSGNVVARVEKKEIFTKKDDFDAFSISVNKQLNGVVLPINLADFKSGGRLTTDGGIQLGSNYDNYLYTENYFFVPKGTKIHYKGQQNSGWAFVCMYDYSKSCINTILGQGSTTTTEGDYTFANDGYVRVCVPNARFNFYSFTSSVEGLLDKIEKQEEYPSYLSQERDRVLSVLTDRLANDVSVFSFNTDQHFRTDADFKDTIYDPNRVLSSIKALNNITQHIPFDCCVYGGDVVGYEGENSHSVSGIIGSVLLLNSVAKKANCPSVSLSGNHDAWQNNSEITAIQMYNANTRMSQYSIFEGYGNKDNCCGWIDNKVSKIRYIFVDTETTNGRTSEHDSRHFLEYALPLIPSDYKCVIFSHRPLTAEFANIIKITKISDGSQIDGFQDALNFGSILDGYSDKIIAVINGHTHADVWAVSNSGILYIETTASVATERGYTYENIPNNPQAKTATESSFDIFVIDQNAQTIEAVRFGVGCNRKWKYKGAGIGQLQGYPQTIVRD